jgi:ribonuclease HI
MLPFLYLGGEHRRLYREAQLAYIISDEADPTNHPIFSLDAELGSNLLQLTDAPKAPLEIRKQCLTLYEDSPLITSVWKMFFDRASFREGVGVGVVLVSPIQEIVSLSFKLEFEATNNVAEYEALILGFRDAKDMGISEISMFGDAELIVQQIINIYQAKHPQLRSYRNEVWNLIDSFFSAFNISFILREDNVMADSLAISEINFRVPLPSKLGYDVEVRYGPSVLDNIKYWKVFEDDLEIIRFLESVDEFSTLHIDQDHDFEGDPPPDVFLNKISNHHIVHLPSNHIPKGLVPLDRLFDGSDVAVKFKGPTEDVDVAECNIGT